MLEDRLTPSSAGDLDPTFGTGGKALIPFDLGDGTRASASAVVVQPTGGIVLAGTASTAVVTSPHFAVSRLTPDGALDTTFGHAGTATAAFDPDKFGVSSASGSAAAIQPDGKIVVVGTASNGNSNSQQFAVARFTPNGFLDTTFGNGGMVAIPVSQLGGQANAVAIQPDGKIVLAGAQWENSTTVLNSDFALIRLNPDGTLDSSFGTGGKVIVPFDLGAADKSDIANAVLIQPDGKVVAVGTAERRNEQLADAFMIDPQRDFAAVRLNADGSLDSSFGGGGKVVVPIDRPGFPDDAASAAFLQPDGRIVLAGTSANLADLRGFNTPHGDFAVVRLNADGSLDNTFATDGKETIPIDLGGTDGLDRASAVTVQPSGKILVAGTATRAALDTDYAVVRLNPDGILDADFGTGGRAVIPINAGGTNQDTASAIALQPQGKILVAGSAAIPSATSQDALGESDMAVVRLDGGASESGTALVGGRPDGTAVTLAPTGGQYAVTDSFTFFPGFPGPVRTATADVTGDGVADYIGGAGPGGGPNVIVLDGKTGAKVASFFAFESSFTGGVFVAAADLNGDGKAEVIVTPDQGGGPVVAVFDGAKLAGGQSADASQLTRFLGIDDPAFRGGARPAVGDVSGDGTPDLLVSAGFLGGPRVALYDGGTITGGTPVKLVPDFFAFEDSLRNGAFVTAGDVTGDGKADVAFGGGPGGAPRVRVFDAAKLLAAGSFGNLDAIASAAQVANFFAGDASSRGGVRLAMRDTDGDGTADLITGSGEGEPASVRVYKAATLLASATPSADQTLAPFGGATLADGVFVG